MNYRIIFFITGLTLVIMGSVLFFAVSSGAKTASTEVLRQHEDRALHNPGITKANWNLGDPAFSSDPHSCTVPFNDPAYINVVLQYQQVPSSCTAFVNDKYAGTDKDLMPDCIGQCPYGEFSRTIPLGYLDVRDSHVVRVCCNDICIEKVLSALCE